MGVVTLSGTFESIFTRKFVVERTEVLSLGSLARTLQEALEAMDIAASASAYPPERKKGALVLTRGNRGVYVHTSVKDADDYFQQLRPVIFRSIPVKGLELTAIFGE